MSNSFTRRDFLRWASAGAGAAAVGGGIWITGRNAGTGDVKSAAVVREPRGKVANGSGDVASTDAEGRTTEPSSAAAPPTADPAARRLVVIEMDGGNDGLSMVVPYGVGGYYDRRARTSIAAGDVLTIDDRFGLHPNLGRLHSRGGLAIVQGVGSFSPDLSHFDMQDRWWSGDPNGRGTYDTGVLGRLADLIGDPAAAAVAVSHGQANHPIIRSRTAPTMSIPGSGGGYLAGANSDEGMRYVFQQAFGRFASVGGDGWLGRLRISDGRAASLATRLVAAEQAAQAASDSGEEAVEYPGTTLGEGLRLAAQLFSSDGLTRIIHVPMNENFDTHDNHLDPYSQIMNSFDEALEAFRIDLDRRGLADSVLIMTTSEFGRRLSDNGSNGLDHGTASTTMLIGPVNSGLYGQLPSFDDLDDTDNLKATVGFDQYYATVFEKWFGVPSSEMFKGGVALLDGPL